MKKVICLIALLITMVSAFSQDKEAMAKIYYTNAEEFFNKKTTKDYESCVTELEKAENALGTTNSKILFLKIKAMYEFSNTFLYYAYDIENSLTLFFKITDIKQYPLEKYSEILKISDLFKEYKKDHQLEKIVPPRYKTSDQAFFAKGLAYYYSTTPDYELATDLFLSAIQKDTVGSVTQVIITDVVNKDMEEKSKPNAFKIYLAAAEKGNSYEMGHVGVAYQFGTLVDFDCDKAIYWYTKSAEKGQVGAMYLLGNLFSIKDKTQNCFQNNNDDQAINWYLQAAEKGNLKSMERLTELYKKNGEKDKAKEWLEKAEDAKLFGTIGEAKDYTKIVYSSFPYIAIKSIDKKEVELKTEMSDLPFKAKPTLIVTWSAYWCNPCIRKIDTLFDLRIQDTYNIILINKDKKNIDTIIAFINQKHPKWRGVKILFDSNESLISFDRKSAPCFIWVDKDLNIVYSYLGYTINASTIISTLDDIYKGKLKTSNIKLFDSKGALVEAEDMAAIKYIVSKEKDLMKLQIFYHKKNEFLLKGEFYYAQDKNGILSPMIPN